LTANRHEIQVDLDLGEALAGRLANPSDPVSDLGFGGLRLDTQSDDVRLAAGQGQQLPVAGSDQDRRRELDRRRRDRGLPHGVAAAGEVDGLAGQQRLDDGERLS